MSRWDEISQDMLMNLYIDLRKLADERLGFDTGEQLQIKLIDRAAFDKCHFQKQPKHGWQKDLRGEAQLEQDRQALKIAKLNLSIAMDAFDISWKMLEESEREMKDKK